MEPYVVYLVAVLIVIFVINLLAFTHLAVWSINNRDRPSFGLQPTFTDLDFLAFICAFPIGTILLLVMLFLDKLQFIDLTKGRKPK